MFFCFLFVLIPNFSTHQRPHTPNPTVEDIRTHWFCFAIQTVSGWAPLLIESLLVMGGSVCRAQQERKKKKEPERRFLFISRWKLCWLSQYAQHIHPPGLFVCTSEGHIWSSGNWFTWYSAVFCFSMSVFLWVAQRLSWFLGAFWNNTSKEQHGPNSIITCKLPGCLQWGCAESADSGLDCEHKRSWGSFQGRCVDMQQ